MRRTILLASPMEPLVENQETETEAMLCKTLNAAKIDNDVSCQLFSVGPKKTFAVVSMKLSNEWTMNSDRKWSCSVSSGGRLVDDSSSLRRLVKMAAPCSDRILGMMDSLLDLSGEKRC